MNGLLKLLLLSAALLAHAVPTPQEEVVDTGLVAAVTETTDVVEAAPPVGLEETVQSSAVSLPPVPSATPSPVPGEDDLAIVITEPTEEDIAEETAKDLIEELEEKQSDENQDEDFLSFAEAGASCDNNDKNYLSSEYEGRSVTFYLSKYIMEKISDEDYRALDDGKVPFFQFWANRWGMDIACEWGSSCEVPTCEEARDNPTPVDFRAWLVMKAIQGVYTEIRNLYEDFDGALIGGYIDRHELIEKVTRNFPQNAQKETDKQFSIIGVIGASLGMLGPWGVVPGGILGAISASKDLQAQPFDADEANKEIEKQLGNILNEAADTFRSGAELLYKQILRRGNPSNADSDKQKRASEMADVFYFFHPLGDRTDAATRRRDLALSIRRIMLSTTLKASKHFVVKNQMPAQKAWPTSKWVEGCKKMKGAWADEGRGICWTLQAVRVGHPNWAPWTDHAHVGSELGEFDISSQELFENADECAKTCGDAMCPGSFDEMTKFPNNRKLPQCLFNLPVLDRWSVCDSRRQSNFPYYNGIGDDCNSHEPGEATYIGTQGLYEKWRSGMNEAAAGLWPCDKTLPFLSAKPGCGN